MYAYVTNNPLSFTDPMGLFENVPSGCVTNSTGFGYICPFIGEAGPGDGFGGSPYAMDEILFRGPHWPAYGGGITPLPLQGPTPQEVAEFMPQSKICTGNAHGVYNNLPTRAPHQVGAYGVPETPGTAAIDRSQFLPPGSSRWTGVQKNAYIERYRLQISGYIPDGQGGYVQIFNGVSDNMGPSAGVRALLHDYPGRVLFELPGGWNWGNVNGMEFRVPWAMPCPHF